MQCGSGASCHVARRPLVHRPAVTQANRYRRAVAVPGSTYLRCVVLTGAAGSAPSCPAGPRSTCARQNSSTACRPRGTRTRSRHLLSTGSSTSGRYDLPHSAGRRTKGITAYRQLAHQPPTCFRTPSREDPAALSRHAQYTRNGTRTSSDGPGAHLPAPLRTRRAAAPCCPRPC